MNEHTKPEGEPSTQELLIRSAQSRSRVAEDVAELRAALEPEHLKERATLAAERKAAGLVLRYLDRLGALPAKIGGYARRHPVASAMLGSGVAFISWRLLRRKH
jgi:hypothetical protein